MPVLHPHAKGFLKSVARNSSTLVRLSNRIRGIRGLERIEDLDACFDRALGNSPEMTPAAMAKLMKIYLKPPADLVFPDDPFSREYADIQRELYVRVAGKSYETENEASLFDFEREKDDFFPYNTKSSGFVGGQLLSQGFLIRNMDLKPGGSIVEFGAGWGNSTFHLAMMGFEMTAVEVNKPSIALMHYRAGLHGRRIRTAEQDMVEFARTTDQRFDAALFMACFHHCHDHIAMVGHLDRIIRDDGAVYFADEPISSALSPSMPYPWGLRMDAFSLYYVRKWGWLEMGYQKGYFRELLRRAGWNVKAVPSTIVGVEDLYVARKARPSERAR